MKTIRKPHKLTEEAAHKLGKAFWNIVRLYGFNRNEQALLLGKTANRGTLSRYESEGSIPVEPDVFSRVGHLLGVHKSLRILFPHNREVVYQWMKTSRPEFGGQSAIEYIGLEELGTIERLASVRRYLDQVRTI